MDCLKRNDDDLTSGCLLVVRKRAKIEVLMPKNDFSLVSQCGSLIQVEKMFFISLFDEQNFFLRNFASTKKNKISWFVSGNKSTMKKSRAHVETLYFIVWWFTTLVKREENSFVLLKFFLNISDARFHKNLIEKCHEDIFKQCPNMIDRPDDDGKMKIEFSAVESRKV